MHVLGFGFSYFGLFGAPGWVCIALVENLVLTSKYLNLIVFTVIVPLHQIHSVLIPKPIWRWLRNNTILKLGLIQDKYYMYSQNFKY